MSFIDDNLRIKIKFANYFEKHKGKHLKVNKIKQSMKKMQIINLNTIPDECYDKVKEIINQMEELFKMKENEVLKEYVNIQK